MADIPLSNIAGAAPSNSPQFTGTATYNGTEIGFRGVPITDQNANYTFVADDAGKARRKTGTTAYTYTVNNNVHQAGDVLCAINTGASANLTIAAGTGVTLQLAGTTTTGNRTVPPGGIAYIFMQSPSLGLVSGPGVT